MLVGGLGSLDGVGGGDLPDVQTGRVQAPLPERLGNGLEVEDRGGGEGAFLEVGGDVDLEVADIDKAVRGIAVAGGLALFRGGELTGLEAGHHGAVATLVEMGLVGACGRGRRKEAAKHGEGD